MKTRTLLRPPGRTCGILVILILCLIGRSHAQKPNIVILVADDLGWADVGYHGGAIRTPHIDRLSREGLSLERFYVSPICSPTRAALLTGRHPLRYGMDDGVCSPLTTHGLPPREQTVAELLTDAGYSQRGCIGKWHLGLSSRDFHPLNQGFTFFYGHLNGALDYFTHHRYGELDWHRGSGPSYDEGYATLLLGNEAVRFVQEAREPFLLYVPFNAPHSPMQAKHEHLVQNGFDATRPIMANSSSQRGQREGQTDYGRQGRGNDVRQTYSAMVQAMDEQIGRILQALDRRGLESRTLVLFHSDNGGVAHFGGSNVPLRGGKFTYWEGGVRVPAIVRWPGRIPAGKRSEAVIGCVDVFPTLANLAGIEVEGKSEIDGLDRMAQWLDVESVDPERLLYLGPDVAVSQRWKWVKGELFDLHDDPYEKQDIAEVHPDVCQQIQSFISNIESKRGPKTKIGSPKSKGWRPPKEWQLP